MCGITGIYHLDRARAADRQELQKMTELLAHRGPDDVGYWGEQNIALGHRRLSIIDLSDSGHQPMSYNNNQLVLTYNGEIYNYPELREELKSYGYSFRSNSDTEVILAAYCQWGEECVTRFNGMWAFALWDSSERTLFCSRDRFGIKPLYYILNDHSLYFASEAKALYPLKDCSKEVNYEQLQRYLQLGWIVYHDETLLRDIKNLPAAHNMIVKNGKVQIKRYWDIVEFETDHRPFREKSEHFASLFKDAVEKHMRSDVPVGTCLSGGLDSSSILSQICDSFPAKPMDTFSVYYSSEPGYDERKYINCYSGFENISQHLIEPSGKEIQEHFLNFIWHQDFPTGGSSTFSQYFVMQLAKRHNMKVLLDGQGGDEILAGYHHYFFRYFADLIKDFKWKSLQSLCSSYRKVHHTSSVELTLMLMKSLSLSIISEQLYYRLAGKYSQPMILNKDRLPDKFLIDLPSKPTSRLNNILYQELFVSSLPNLLHYEDRNSMAFSIESRVPFLDYRLVEFCFKILSEDKIAGAETKRLLREGLGHLLPEPIRTRQDKMGFVTPGEILWLRNELSGFIRELNLDPAVWDIKQANSIIERFKKGENRFGKIIWRIVNVHYWMQQVNQSRV